MGNKGSKLHLETAQKTGVCTIANLKLEEIPPEIFKIAKLRTLDASNNRLARWPSGIERMGMMKMLKISNNRLTEINVSMVGILLIDHCLFDRLVAQIGDAARLKQRSDKDSRPFAMQKFKNGNQRRASFSQLNFISSTFQITI